jgi:hypothetical protein
MQKLRQYVDLIKQFKVKKQEINALIGDEQTKIHRFFDGLATRRWKDDDAAMQELYDGLSDKKRASYRALKTELKKKLKSLILLIDFKQPDVLNDYQQAHYEVFRTEAATKILLGRGKIDAGMDLAQHLLDTALKFEATSAIIFAAKNLRNYYRYLSPNQKKYEYYRNLHDEYFEYYRLESLAESYYCDIVGNFVNNRATKKWVQPIAQEYVSNALRKYKSRYLTEDAHARTNLLIKLFALAPESDYDARRIKTRIKVARIDLTPLLSGTKKVIGANFKNRNFELSNKKLWKKKYLAS